MAVAVPARSNGVPPVPFEHEELVAADGERSGVHLAVAIHSTVLGPALGGVRMWSYGCAADAERDALRLAKGMTLKAAAAGLDLGGGKGVICAPPGGFADDDREAALLDFGDLVQSLGGRYVTAEDVGISPCDIEVIARRTSHLTGLPPERGGSGDPSPFTAIGVEAAMRACLRERFGTPALRGRTVVIIGLGHVGTHLARRLRAAGCEVVASDVVPAKRRVAVELGTGWVEPSQALGVECDVLAPCALGGAIDAETVAGLRCTVVCGSANNQLADDAMAEELARREILYAPDFIANAGGLINVYREIRGYGPERARELVDGIEPTMQRILEAASERDVTPLRAARELAAERLGAKHATAA